MVQFCVLKSVAKHEMNSVLNRAGEISGTIFLCRIHHAEDEKFHNFRILFSIFNNQINIENLKQIN